MIGPEIRELSKVGLTPELATAIEHVGGSILEAWALAPAELDRLLILADWIEETGVRAPGWMNEELCEAVRFAYKFGTAGGLKRFEQYAEHITRVNMEFGPVSGEIEGQWYWGDDTTNTLYYGTFGPDHGEAGETGSIIRETFPLLAEYRTAIEAWDDAPEFVSDGVRTPADSDWVTQDLKCWREHNMTRRVIVVPDGMSWQTFMTAMMEADRFWPDLWQHDGIKWKRLRIHTGTFTS